MRRRSEGMDQGLWRAVRMGGVGTAEGGKASLADEEAIRCHAEGDMMVQPAPGAPLEMSEPDLLLEFPVVLFNAAAPFGVAYQRGQGRVGGQ